MQPGLGARLRPGRERQRLGRGRTVSANPRRDAVRGGGDPRPCRRAAPRPAPVAPSTLADRRNRCSSTRPAHRSARPHRRRRAGHPQRERLADRHRPRAEDLDGGDRDSRRTVSSANEDSVAAPRQDQRGARGVRVQPRRSARRRSRRARVARRPGDLRAGQRCRRRRRARPRGARRIAGAQRGGGAIAIDAAAGTRAPGRRTEIITLSRPAPLAAATRTRPGPDRADPSGGANPPARSSSRSTTTTTRARRHGLAAASRTSAASLATLSGRSDARRPPGDDDRDGRRGVDRRPRRLRVRRRWPRRRDPSHRRPGGTPARAPPASERRGPGQQRRRRARRERRRGAARGRAGPGGAGAWRPPRCDRGPHALAGSGQHGRARPHGRDRSPRPSPATMVGSLELHSIGRPGSGAFARSSGVAPDGQGLPHGQRAGRVHDVHRRHPRGQHRNDDARAGVVHRCGDADRAGRAARDRRRSASPPRCARRPSPR